MAIVTCEHHSGMGLCSDCAREVDDFARRERQQRFEAEDIRKVREAALIVEGWGRRDLASLLREAVARRSK